MLFCCCSLFVNDKSFTLEYIFWKLILYFEPVQKQEVKKYFQPMVIPTLQKIYPGKIHRQVNQQPD